MLEFAEPSLNALFKGNQPTNRPDRGFKAVSGRAGRPFNGNTVGRIRTVPGWGGISD